MKSVDECCFSSRRDEHRNLGVEIPHGDVAVRETGDYRTEAQESHFETLFFKMLFCFVFFKQKSLKQSRVTLDRKNSYAALCRE